MLKKSIWSLVASISGKNRKEILSSLNSPATPTLLAKSLKLHRSVVSRALLFMEENEIVKCLNPEDKVQRFYKRTKIGDDICKKLEKISPK